MATRIKHNETNCFYFVTFTCYKWLPLIDQSNLYNYLPKWAKNLAKKGCEICGYVAMPNHIHLLVFIHNQSGGLNKVMGEAKRFMSYEIVKRLKLNQKFQLINYLSKAVSENDKLKGQKHLVFKSSFDAKTIRGNKAINSVLDYIHYNPVSGKWNLVEGYIDYPYSSAAYYENRTQKILKIKDYREILKVFCE